MKDETPQPEIRILKTATASSLSGKSTLTYNIGCDVEGQVYLRVEANSGTGYVKPEYVPLGAILRATENVPSISAFHLRPVFTGKSTNSPGFMLAVLKAEKLVRLKDEKERTYVAIDAKDFLASLKTLMESQPDIGVSTPVAVIRKGKKTT